MKGWFMIKRIVLSIITLIVLVILCVVIWFFFFLNPNHYKADLLNSLNKNPNVEVAINGDMELDIWRMELTAKDVTIHTKNQGLELAGSWQKATLHTSLKELLFSPAIPVSALQLDHGEITINNHYQLQNTKSLVRQQQGLVHIDAWLKGFNGNLHVKSAVTEKGQTLILSSTKATYTAQKNKVEVRLPELSISKGLKALTINNIFIDLNGNQGKMDVQIKHFKPLRLSLDYQAEHFDVERIFNLKGYRLKLNQLAVHADVEKDKKLDGKIDIEAKQGQLRGINLNKLAHSTNGLIVSLNNGQGIGGAFQRLRHQLMPLLNNGQIKPNIKEMTTLDKLTINNTLSNNHLVTDQLRWQAPEFVITGKGKVLLKPFVANYPLTLTLTGASNFIIPYHILYRNHTFDGKVDEENIRQQIQPIIQRAVQEALQKRFRAAFR